MPKCRLAQSQREADEVARAGTAEARAAEELERAAAADAGRIAAAAIAAEAAQRAAEADAGRLTAVARAALALERVEAAEARALAAEARAAVVDPRWRRALPQISRRTAPRTRRGRLLLPPGVTKVGGTFFAAASSFPVPLLQFSNGAMSAKWHGCRPRWLFARCRRRVDAGGVGERRGH